MSESRNKELRPNFFIIGAPRCGTTALSRYLEQHPDICFSKPKEPHFFCTDLPGRRDVLTFEEYLSSCFGHCQDATDIVGEGSVWYLYSREAISNILSFNSKAKFIIMVRNPIEMCIALHAKFVESLWESEPSFEKSWMLQSARLQKKSIPKHCKEPRLLIYKEVAMLGRQLEYVMNIVPESQRMVIVFDDFVEDTLAVYKGVLEFLGVKYDGRKEFPKVNESVVPKNIKLWEFAMLPPEGLVKLVDRGKRVFGVRELGPLPLFKKILIKKPNRKIPDYLVEELKQTFRDDVILMGDLLERDLSHWIS